MCFIMFAAFTLQNVNALTTMCPAPMVGLINDEQLISVFNNEDIRIFRLLMPNYDAVMVNTSIDLRNEITGVLFDLKNLDFLLTHRIRPTVAQCLPYIDRINTNMLISERAVSNGNQFSGYDIDIPGSKDQCNITGKHPNTTLQLEDIRFLLLEVAGAVIRSTNETVMAEKSKEENDTIIDVAIYEYCDGLRTAALMTKDLLISTTSYHESLEALSNFMAPDEVLALINREQCNVRTALEETRIEHCYFTQVGLQCILGVIARSQTTEYRRIIPIPFWLGNKAFTVNFPQVAPVSHLTKPYIGESAGCKLEMQAFSCDNGISLSPNKCLFAIQQLDEVAITTFCSFIRVRTGKEPLVLQHKLGDTTIARRSKNKLIVMYDNMIITKYPLRIFHNALLRIIYDGKITDIKGDIASRFSCHSDTVHNISVLRIWAGQHNFQKFLQLFSPSTTTEAIMLVMMCLQILLIIPCSIAIWKSCKRRRNLNRHNNKFLTWLMAAMQTRRNRQAQKRADMDPNNQNSNLALRHAPQQSHDTPTHSIRQAIETENTTTDKKKRRNHYDQVLAAEQQINCLRK